VLNRLVAQVGLNGAGIDAVIGKLVAATVPQHVRVHLDVKTSGLRSALHHRLKTTIRGNSD